MSQSFLILIKSKVVIFSFIFNTFQVLSKKSFPTPRLGRQMVFFFLMFRSVIHLKSVSIYGVRQVSSCVFFSPYFVSYSHYLLKIFFSPLNYSTELKKQKKLFCQRATKLNFPAGHKPTNNTFLSQFSSSIYLVILKLLYSYSVRFYEATSFYRVCSHATELLVLWLFKLD